MLEASQLMTSWKAIQKSIVAYLHYGWKYLHCDVSKQDISVRTGWFKLHLMFEQDCRLQQSQSWKSAKCEYIPQDYGYRLQGCNTSYCGTGHQYAVGYYFVNLCIPCKWEAVYSSERVLPIFQNTRRHIPEVRALWTLTATRTPSSYP